MRLLGALFITSILGGGCVVVEKFRQPQAAASCHPSQYWDGTQCRHKGQGQGARKHDGEGKGKKK